jgi:hypothetical protein
VVGRDAVAGFSIGGADAVAVLINFQGRPVEGGQGGDQHGDYAGFANAPGVSADDDYGHGCDFERSSLRVANS